LLRVREKEQDIGLSCLTEEAQLGVLESSHVYLHLGNWVAAPHTFSLNFKWISERRGTMVVS
jgi:hypothetical protein